jgi:hypothetical protein
MSAINRFWNYWVVDDVSLEPDLELKYHIWYIPEIDTIIKMFPPNLDEL